LAGQRAERKRQMQAEYETTLARLDRGISLHQVLPSLGFAALIGLAGWRAWLALPRLASLLAELGWSSVNQSLLLSCAAGAIFLALGLAAMLPQQLRKLPRAA
jgi:hypothetical protein